MEILGHQKQGEEEDDRSRIFRINYSLCYYYLMGFIRHPPREWQPVCPEGLTLG